MVVLALGLGALFKLSAFGREAFITSRFGLSSVTDAYFALDPQYLSAPGEDYHGFRALAERSALADAIKDTSVVTKVPQLGPAWKEQTQALEGWSHFQLTDFQRLKSRFGIDWVLVSYPQSAPLNCHWHNNTLAVCQIP